MMMSQAYIEGRRERNRNAQRQRRAANRTISEKTPRLRLQTPHRLQSNSADTELETQTTVAAAAAPVQPTGQTTDSTKSDMFAANAQRMQMVMNRLSMLVRIGDKNIKQIEQPLLALARGIDFSVANGEVPSKAPAVSMLVKQICQWKCDSLILPLIMTLMVSVKNACKLGWFSDTETQEIIDLYKELSNSFCLPEYIDSGSSPSNLHIQTVMERYYPWLRLGSVIACLEVKPGSGAYLVDFHISKNAGFSPQEKIRLFVAQSDNTETSSCLTSPQQVNFLLNGKGVMGRVNCATMDTGPQIPTNVTALLKFGTNLLQAVGNFSGNYVIAVAFMGVVSFRTSDLKDYVQPGVTTQSSDLESDVIVGPSRVSLNCPISCKRIKIPVKGQSCKHIQCFDFDNFVEINSRRPSWRCPHCNQCVSFLDIRRDQNMVKILNEVGGNVQDVIISPDGSWKNTSKSDGHSVGSGDADVNHQQSPNLRGVSSSSCGISEILDLTMEGDMMDMVQDCDTEDKKPSHVDLLNSMGSDVTMQTEASPSNQANQSTVSQIDDFWSGLYLQNLEPSDERFDNQLMANTFYPSDRSPVLISASSTIQQPGYHNHLSSHGGVGMPGQQSQFVSSVMNNQYVRVSSVPAIINRTPTAQPLAPSSGTHRTMSSQSQALPSMTYSADRSTTNYAGVERAHDYSRSALNHTQRPEMTRFQSQQHSTGASQNAMQFLNSAAFNSNILMHQQQQLHQMQHQQKQQQQQQQQQQQYLHSPMQTTGILQTSQHPQTHHQQTSAQIGANNSATRHIMTSHPTSSLLTSPAYQNQTFRSGQSFPSNAGVPGISVQQPQSQPRSVQQVSRTEQLVNIPADSNLRPAGRMRGSLSGRAYEDARNQFLSPSMQQTRLPIPPQDLTTPPPGVPPELHEMITNLSVPPSSSPRA